MQHKAQTVSCNLSPQDHTTNDEGSLSLNANVHYMCGCSRFPLPYFYFSFNKVAHRNKNKLRTNWGWNHQKNYKNNKGQQNLLVLIKKSVYYYNSCASIQGGGILIGEIIIDDDKRGPWEGLGLSMLMLTICTAGRERSGKEYEELLTKHGYVDVQYRQNPVLYLIGAVFARKP